MTLKSSDAMPDILPLINDVRKCATLPEGLDTLARTLGTLCRAEKTGVFLLDESKRQLLLSALWSSGHGNARTAQESVSLDRAEDPLCYCIVTGKTYSADIIDCASMQLLDAAQAYCLAFPLIAGGNITMGGVLVTMQSAPEAAVLRAGEVLCACAGLLFGAMLQQRRDSSLLRSLGDELHSIEEQRANADSPVLGRILGQSAGIRQVRERILKVASTDASVLITGETGTGKELVADAIHHLSKRRSAPFLKVNCAALPGDLLESELFGHKKGAFSGAVSDSQGLLRSADGGTVLLDEIGDMPTDLQAKLLRVLQDQQVRPLGDVRHYPVSIRIVAATNSELREAMEQGRFRSDLYHRLAAFQINIPPLRERQEDILPLAAHFTRQLCARYEREACTLPPQTLMTLTSYSFPGNVRELVNIIENAILSADARNPGLHISLSPGEQGGRGQWSMDLKTHLVTMEQSIISHTLAHFQGNASKAAGALGIPRSTLMSKLRKGIVAKAPAFPQPATSREMGKTNGRRR